MTKPTSDRADAFFAYLAAVSPPALKMWTATTESDFRDAAVQAIESAIARMESGARLCGSMDELGLSWILAELLAAAFVPSVSEGYHNGHVDVTISHPAGLFSSILGECKIYDGFKHHCDGCEQLLKRYSSGRSARAFCLDFFRTPAMYGKLKKLREEFDEKRPLEQLDSATDHGIKGAFLTAHKHFTAAVVELLHLGCNIYHPEAALPVPQEPGTDG